MEEGKLYLIGGTEAIGELKEGWNTLTFDLELIDGKATLAVNDGEAVALKLDTTDLDYVTYITFYADTDVLVDELLVISEDEVVLEASEEDKAAADAVIELIKAIETADNKKAAVEAARAAFDALTQVQADLVDSMSVAEDTLVNYYDVLVEAEKNLPDVEDGWVKEDGNWVFYKDGQKATGWLKDGGKWYYMNAEGIMQTGWVKDNGKWYYLNNAMVTGWVQVGANWYYMDGNGAMLTGWVKAGANWYYLNANGAMATGWLKDGGKWYYLNANGAMATGWVNDGGKWYYLNSSMATGWVKVGNNWYYLNNSMATGWVKVGANWYYLSTNGAMVTGTQNIDGKTYHFAANGAWIPS